MKKWKVLSSLRNITSEKSVIDELFNLRKISDRKKYLEPRIEDIRLEGSGIDTKEVKKAVKRVNEAIQKGEKIIILGDYDVDGICASAILWETIYSKYKNIFPYIPDRFTQGYGISKKSIDSIFEKYPDVKLIITVDNGIVAADSADYVAEKGVDLIITDHHLGGEVLPKASAIVHTTDLCGAGVSWILARELNFISEDEINKKLELACLATIADLVPLTGLNRLVVKFGLNYLRNTKRVGLSELIQISGIDKKNIGTYQIGHMIGPRLNASGRVGHAIESLRLICTNDKNYAQNAALLLENTNKIRQKMVLDSMQHADLSMITDDNSTKIVAVYHESYSEGIVGLLASRLVEKNYKPSFAISVKSEISKGSARSISGVNIVEMLRSVSTKLLEVGGHPMAAGFSVKTEKIEELIEALSNESEKIPDHAFEREIKIDMEIPLSIVTESLFEKIQGLSPFGMGNPEPVFLARNVKIISTNRIGKDSSHLKLILDSGGKKIEAIGFGMGDLEVEKNDKGDVVFTIDVNIWRERKTLQLKIKDLKKI